MIDNASVCALFPRTEPISFMVTHAHKRPRRGRHAEAARVETPTDVGRLSDVHAGRGGQGPKSAMNRHGLYSITSSARPSGGSGTSMPSVRRRARGSLSLVSCTANSRHSWVQSQHPE